MRYGLQGLAIARAISFALVACMLLLVIDRRLKLLTSVALQGRFVLNLVAASLLMGASSRGIFWLAQKSFEGHGFYVRSSIVALLLAMSTGLYLAICRVLSIPEVHSVTRIPASLMAKFSWASWINSGEGTA